MLCILASSAAVAVRSPSGLLTHSQSCVQVVVVIVVLILASTAVTRVVCWKEEEVMGSVEGVATTRPEMLALQKSL